MDIRRLLNIVFAHLTRDVLPDSLERFVDEVLREKFDHEMTPEELRRVRYRRKERELGIVPGGGQAAMDAFRMPAAGGRA
jgi:hypothetical protein